MAISVKNLNFTVAQLLGNNYQILVWQSEKPVFKDGKPTDEKYWVAEVTTAESGFEKISVKLEGKGIDITNETLITRNSAFDFVFVKFINDSAKIYTDFKTGEQKICAKANGIELYNNTDDDIELG